MSPAWLCVISLWKYFLNQLRARSRLPPVIWDDDLTNGESRLGGIVISEPGCPRTALLSTQTSSKKRLLDKQKSHHAKQLLGLLGGLSAVLASVHTSEKLYNKKKYHNSQPRGRTWLDELLQGNVGLFGGGPAAISCWHFRWKEYRFFTYTRREHRGKQR